MVRTVINDNKGLVQYGGQSGLAIERAAINPVVQSGQMSAALQIVNGTATVSDDAQTTDFSDLVPAGSFVLCGEIAVETASAGGGTVNITDVGTANYNDCYSGTIALSINAVAAQVISPIAIPPDGDDGSDSAITVRVTHGDVGTQTTDAILRVSLVCVTAATS